ncbi:MAG: hypothetical protein LGL72_17945 [Acidibrevibacterium sp.]|uniref:hypothetical protein n=1 Tax=Acidibrevibacterium fodinaquatile TaxID=1969806 RepID=UPI0023A8F579|nr:hypothetical protein [Acidibrevibacterium fodinaquatile]MCA7121228.1 hypothetical protein [Acidibrevibacterium fodinaquatile]
MSAAAPKQPMSVFNQAAEDRLKELLEKRKRDKLTRAEALEVRELQLLKAKARQAKEGAAIAQQVMTPRREALRRARVGRYIWAAGGFLLGLLLGVSVLLLAVVPHLPG